MDDFPMSAARTFLAAAVAFTVSCSGATKRVETKPSQGGSDGAIPLDIHGEWIDPEGNRPKAAAERTLADATKNARAKTIAITNATILTASGKRFDKGTIVLQGGSIKHVGGATAIPSGATVIDGTGKFVTPGLIDTHSHIGVYASPHARAHSDGNEAVAPTTAHARAEYGYWPQDPAITRARAGGVTTALILPGSANLIGGRGVTVQMKTGRSVREVMFPGQAATLKMACGENPKRVYGKKGGPQTRMGLYAAFRAAYQKAADYNNKLTAYTRARALWLQKRARAIELTKKARARGKKGYVKPEPAPERPPYDSGLATLASVLRGEVLVQVHCYRASEIREMVRIADEFGFKIRSFHHALGAYKVRDVLARKGISISTWADWWGFKLEAFDGIPENAALFTEAGGRAVIHSDQSIGIQRLNQEAAKAMWSGRHAGIKISEDQALRWITANPAWVLGIHSVTGTLEPGKRADVVLWSGHPFSVYSLPDVVVQAGEIAYTRKKGLTPTDFELGNSALDPVGGAR